MSRQCCGQVITGNRMHNEQGFVMLAVIWVLLAMLAGVALFSHWVHNSLQHAQQRQQQLNSRIAAQSAIDAVVYVRLAGQQSALGVSVPGDAPIDLMDLFDFGDMGALLLNLEKAASVQTFPFDSQVWQHGELRFVAQDGAGLIGLTHYDHDAMLGYLLRNAPPDLTVSRLRDSYLDYRDADNERRLSGAEAFEYRTRQRALPLNGALRTPLQLRDVMYWDRLLQRWSNGQLLYRFRIDGDGIVNINSASPQVLELMVGDAALAEQLFAKRQEKPYASVFELPFEAGSGMGSSSSLSILPRDGLRFWWWRAGENSAWVSELRYDGLQPGPQAVYRDWLLRVDVPPELAGQQALALNWGLMPEYPDYLGRKH